MPMRPSSAKSKGRRLQQQLVQALLRMWPELEDDDLRSNPMGSHGEDVLMSPRARALVPYSFECKNAEGMSPVFAAWKQAVANAHSHTPCVVIKKNHEQMPLCVLRLDDFLSLVRATNGTDRRGEEQAQLTPADVVSRLRALADSLESADGEAGAGHRESAAPPVETDMLDACE